MAYTPRELRAADLFSLFIVVFGVILIAIGGIRYSIGDDTPTKAEAGALVKGLSAKPSPLPTGAREAICGLTLGCLGAALAVKVRQLRRNGGRESNETPVG